MSLLGALLGAVLLLALAGPATAGAAVSCPNANPVVNENNCMGEGTTANREAMENYSEDIGGFTTADELQPRRKRAAQDRHRSAASFPSTSVNISVYRIGYYGGDGARLIPTAGATTSRSTTPSNATRATRRPVN